MIPTTITMAAIHPITIPTIMPTFGLLSPPVYGAGSFGNAGVVGKSNMFVPNANSFKKL